MSELLPQQGVRAVSFGKICAWIKY